VRKYGRSFRREKKNEGRKVLSKNVHKKKKEDFYYQEAANFRKSSKKKISSINKLTKERKDDAKHLEPERRRGRRGKLEPSLG